MRQRQDTELLLPTGNELSVSTGQRSDFLAAAPSDHALHSEGEANPLHKLQLLLKGRYRWAIGLAVAGALLGGASGFLLGKKQYVSRGLVRVQPVLPSVLKDEERGMAFFDSYIDSQVTTLQTQRVLDMAVQNPAWRATGRPTTPDEVEELTKSIQVLRPKGSQLIQVTCTDPDPAVAQAAVKSLLESYQKIFTDQDTIGGDKLLEVLQRLQQVAESEQAAVRNQILTIAQGFGTDDLQRLYDKELEDLDKQKTMLGDLKLRLAAVSTVESQKPDVAAGANGAPSTRPSDLSVEEIALHDARMDRLLEERRMARRRLAALEVQGLGPNHHTVIAARADLADVEQRVDKWAETFRRLAASGSLGTAPGQSVGVADAASDPRVLQARIDAVTKLYEEKQKSLMDIGQKRLKIDKLRQDEAAIKERLDVYRNRLEQLNAQEKISGRIQVTEFGDRPTVDKDTRFKFAGGGAFGGGAVGFGIVVLVGLLDRRFRSPEEVRTSMTGSPMLGVLPELPDDLSDPEQAALTAHFVHQIRTLLQIWDSGSGTQVFSVTSPVSGTGKTSLALALGVSFAAAESRTLLIDCDLVGGGLTSRANAIVKRKIGRLLQREGLLTDKQLDEALALASGSRRRLGEILIELGHLKESDLDSALVRQQKGSVGLLDAINGEDLLDCVAETGIAGLSILPLGEAQAQHASKITPHSLRRVLNEARKHYDAILVDTGPVPGSLEASVVAAEVDGVILCVSRGEHRPLAEKCVQHLVSVGAKVAGVVFNRARTTDVSVYGTTVRTSVPTTSVPATHSADSARFGPMAQAVTYGGSSPESVGAAPTAPASSEAVKR